MLALTGCILWMRWCVNNVGEVRRDAILRATWEVMLRDGVCGVRHRALAAAGVPLSSTTYYFKDIQDLLALQMLTVQHLSSALVRLVVRY